MSSTDFYELLRQRTGLAGMMTETDGGCRITLLSPRYRYFAEVNGEEVYVDMAERSGQRAGREVPLMPAEPLTEAAVERIAGEIRAQEAAQAASAGDAA